MVIVLSLKTSNIGNPDISLTLNIEPIKLSVTENNSPCEPCIENIGNVVPLPTTLITPVVPETCNFVVGVVVPIPTLPPLLKMLVLLTTHAVPL